MLLGKSGESCLLGGLGFGGAEFRFGGFLGAGFFSGFGFGGLEFGFGFLAGLGLPGFAFPGFRGHARLLGEFPLMLPLGPCLGFLGSLGFRCEKLGLGEFLGLRLALGFFVRQTGEPGSFGGLGFRGEQTCGVFLACGVFVGTGDSGGGDKGTWFGRNGIGGRFGGRSHGFHGCQGGKSQGGGSRLFVRLVNPADRVNRPPLVHALGPNQ